MSNKFPAAVRQEVDRLLASGGKPKAVAEAMGLDPNYVRSRKQALDNRLARKATAPELRPSPEVLLEVAKATGK